MDVATALSVAQTLFATLQCAEVRQLCAIYRYESELEKLLDTVQTIKSFLLDADSKCQELTYGGRYWVEDLKNAVYDADDLLDEYQTIAQQLSGIPEGKISKKVRCFFSSKRSGIPEGKISKKVRRFFSSKNQLLFAYKTSGEVKKLREKLDSLAKNHRDFGFSDLYKPVKSREETCSYVHEHDIIGREADKEKIVGLLLQDDSENNISFVSIVGIGGLGKTAFAQLVFNDRRIREAFQEQMCWVCVSENFGVKDILGKMLGEKELIFEDLQRKVRNLIEGKRYLLVLDDVWSEDGGKWDKLKNFLLLGGRGSRILVTTRSKKVAGAIGNYPIHDLPGLSEEDSWDLFKKISSLVQREDEADSGLVEIGKDILRKCANVPLSIRVIASLLRNQKKATWESFEKIDLAEMNEGEDGIMPTLMFSYYHLAPELKCCFSFCSVFPEDYRINKELLISLWLAQGYLVPGANGGKSMEDVGDEYLSILLHRCFFQDFQKDKFGEVNSFKMHDLIHDLARKVAGKESMTLTASTRKFEGKIRHLFFDSNNEGLDNWFGSSICPSKTLRTCMKKDCNSQISGVDAIISNCSRLRVLYLPDSLATRNLPDTLGKLLHLRYLDLSSNYKLEMLPKSITKLHNLQMLKLYDCRNLKELPEQTSKLVNLRVLDIDQCYSLTHMPVGMDKLTCLHTLPMFVVPRDMSNSKQDKIGKLIDLKSFVNNLRDYIRVVHDARNARDDPITVLEGLKFRFSFVTRHEEGDETLLENLFPNNHYIMKMRMRSYAGTKLPSWASMMKTCFPGLVEVELSHCKKLQYLPSPLSELGHLKCLLIKDMENVVYIEGNAPSSSVEFFPSLEKLVLDCMPALKGWWRDIRWMEKEADGGCLVDDNENAVFLPFFPRLSYLSIFRCHRMTYFPPCPRVKELSLLDVNEALTFCMKGSAVGSSCSLKSMSINNSCVFNSLCREFVGAAVGINLSNIENLEEVREGIQSWAFSLQNFEITNCGGWENLATDHLTKLKSLKIKWCDENIQGIAWEYLNSLTSLTICNCKKAVNLPKGFVYLTSLQSLRLGYLHNLEAIGECIKSLTSLQLLQLGFCPELKSLPEEMRHLTSLTKLELHHCAQLKSLPKEMRHLTSLTKLEITKACDELMDRCQEPDGEDWPNICHIPHLHITSDWDYSLEFEDG